MRILLVNRQDDILRRTTGSYSEDKGSQLLAAIEAAVWENEKSI